MVIWKIKIQAHLPEEHMCKNSNHKQVNRENSVKYKKMMQSDKIRFFLEIDFGKLTLTD